MNDKHNEKLTANAQILRKNMTKEERHLWYDFLKGLPFTVNRQKVFGHYIADFYIAAKALVIELDGSQHYETEEREKDRKRDAYFRENGIDVLRYSNDDINKKFDEVCQDILNYLELDTSSVG